MVNDSPSAGERNRTKSRTFFFIMSVSVSRSAEKDSETVRNRLQLYNRTSGRLSGKVPVSLRFSLRRVCPDRRKRDPFRVRHCHIMHMVLPAQLEIFCPDPETVSRRKARESESGNTGNGLTFAPFLPGKTDRIFCFFSLFLFLSVGDTRIIRKKTHLPDSGKTELTRTTLTGNRAYLNRKNPYIV